MSDTQISELEKRVDEVLFYMWDPLGFKAEPYARTEYRSYVKEVLNYLEDGKSSEEISNLLIDIVENRMGLTFSREITQIAGKLLHRHKKAIDSGVC